MVTILKRQSRSYYNIKHTYVVRILTTTVTDIQNKCHSPSPRQAVVLLECDEFGRLCSGLSVLNGEAMNLLFQVASRSRSCGGRLQHAPIQCYVTIKSYSPRETLKSLHYVRLISSYYVARKHTTINTNNTNTKVNYD